MTWKVVHVVTVTMLAAPLAAFVLMTNVSEWDPALREPTFHFYIVSAATVLAAAIGTGLIVVVDSVRTTRNVLLALGFVAIAVIFATHGLSTPGFIVREHEHPYAVIVSAGLSQVVGAAFIAASVLPANWRMGRLARKPPPWLLGGTIAALAAYVVVAMARPEALGTLPSGELWNAALAGATIAMLALAAWRYWRAWAMTRMPGQFAMVAALVLLAESQVSMYYGTVWQLSWWLYHLLMLLAFTTLLGGWAVEARRARSLALFPRALTLRDELDRLKLADMEALEQLEDAMDAKDAYTRHHMGRVAEYAVGIAHEMRLDPARVHVVELAGRIHDIGKVVIPDEVLMKPGKLTDAEFEKIKHHASRGEQIARSSRVLADVARIVRHHHERYDGRGYPDGVAGDAIPVEARIVAVADTFDALTSPRVYRKPRGSDEALAELRRVAGSQLDPECVSAFQAWLDRDGVGESRLPEAA